MQCTGLFLRNPAHLFLGCSILSTPLVFCSLCTTESQHSVAGEDQETCSGSLLPSLQPHSHIPRWMLCLPEHAYSPLFLMSAEAAAVSLLHHHLLPKPLLFLPPPFLGTVKVVLWRMNKNSTAITLTTVSLPTHPLLLPQWVGWLLSERCYFHNPMTLGWAGEGNKHRQLFLLLHMMLHWAEE